MFLFFMKEIKVLVNQYGALIFFLRATNEYLLCEYRKNLQNTHALAHNLCIYIPVYSCYTVMKQQDLK